MRDQHPIRTARRKTLRVDRLGGNAFCLFCGYACLEALTKVSRQWLETSRISKCWIDRLLEVHHVVGEARDPDLTVTLCLNCHREITEGLAREGVNMHPENSPFKLIAAMLRASAVLFDFLAAAYRKWASLLEHQPESKQ